MSSSPWPDNVAVSMWAVSIRIYWMNLVKYVSFSAPTRFRLQQLNPPARVSLFLRFGESMLYFCASFHKVKQTYFFPLAKKWTVQKWRLDESDRKYKAKCSSSSSRFHFPHYLLISSSFRYPFFAEILPIHAFGSSWAVLQLLRVDGPLSHVKRRV